jgi:histidine ammonia-lyase
MKRQRLGPEELALMRERLAGLGAVLAPRRQALGRAVGAALVESIPVFSVPPEYLRTLELRTIAGRWLEPKDDRWTTCVLDRSAAEALFPGRPPEEAVGQTVRLVDAGGDHERRVLGVLQDPLTYRCVPQIHGACRDALRFVEGQVAIELNAHQGNPLIVPGEGRVVSVGNFDSQALATALDLARLALAPVVTACVERTLKLLSPTFSGLPEGLVAREGSWQDGLSELGVAAQAIAAEARLLAQPVSIELASTMQESGVEDRMALSSLGARRLSELLDLGSRVVAIELTVAAQAIDLRRELRLGTGAAATYAFLRERVAFLDSPEQMPLPLEELAMTIRACARPA